MNSREYWIKRAQHREAVSWSNGLEASAALIRVYKQTSTEIRRDINDFYMRYAGENGLSYEQAVREMSRPEMQEWKNSVEGYIREIQNCTDEKVRERLMREYDARSYNSRISRLEGLCGNINMNLDSLYQRANQQFREVLGSAYKDGFYQTLYDIQCQKGFSPFSTIDSEIVENALTYPWSGANFSDRLWKNKNALMDSLRETLTKGMIRGDNIREMSKNIAEKLNASYSNAERLILTESSHIHNTAELSAYEAAGYEQYEFMASPGEKTCEVCGELDGKRFKLSEKQYGVNFPPIHPRCRCTTIGFDPEDEEESDEQEKMSYEDWYRKYVGNGTKPLTNGVEGGIIDYNEVRTAVSDVHYVGKIDVNIYKCVTEDIVTDDVIITDVQISHIKERHPGVFEKYGKYFGEVVSSPDYILEANKPNTALILKQISTENGYTKMALRLHTSADNPSYKNSVITFVEIDERDWNRLLRNKKVLYKHE